MLYTFRSKATGEVLMLARHARPLLEAAGKSPEVASQVRGVFTLEQIPQAIAALEQHVAANPPPEFDETDPEELERARRYVGEHQRAYPLLEMLRKSAESAVPVTWECHDD